MKYTETHEWIQVSDDQVGTVGVSKYAQKELGDIVYVELPKTGAHVEAGDEVVVLESTKAAADVYSPVSGEIIEVNQDLIDNPELVNLSPEEEGWLFKVKLLKKEDLEQLMDESAYKNSIT